MCKPGFLLFLVAWIGGVVAALFKDWLGLWPGLIALFLIGGLIRLVFDPIISRYWLPKE